MPNPPNAGGVVYAGRMLLLPTGQVLFAAGTADVEVYTPSGGPQASWKPVITGYPKKIHAGQAYSLHGRQLNGLSQAVRYGDDAQMATNYPLVRLRHLGTGKVTYCPTFDHSTMGVATGASIESTNFMVPWTAEHGGSDLCVVANGISSDCVKVTVKPAIPRHLGHYEAWNWLIGNLADGPLWVLGPHGPRPIGPFNGRLKERANAAYTKMRQGIEELEVLGREVGELRTKTKPERLPSKPSGARRRKVAV